MNDPVAPQSLVERYSVFSVNGEGRWLDPNERSRLLEFLTRPQTFGETRVPPLLPSAVVSHALVLHRGESRSFLLFNRRLEDPTLILDGPIGHGRREILLSEGRKSSFLYILFQ